MKAATALCVALSLTLSACGATASARPAAASTPALPTPSIAALTLVADQVFPKVQQYGYYVDCVDFPEHGAHPASGYDYSVCPMTEQFHARMAETQARFCCEQNPSPDREIRVKPAPGGGLATVLLVGGRVKVELVIVSVNGKLLVNDIPAKGDVENGTSTPITFQDKPTAPPATPSTRRDLGRAR